MSEPDLDVSGRRELPPAMLRFGRKKKSALMMPNPELSAAAAQWANDVLVWVGFGTLVGLIAKGIMPGRDPGGAVATLAMGIGGSVIGSGTLMYFSEGQRVTPISPLGFAVATGGAFVLLFFYRLLGGRLIREGERSRRPPRPHARRRRYVDSTLLDE